MTREVVGVLIDGEQTWHAGPVGVSDYDTLCGIDANDSKVGHQGLIATPDGQKITCAMCHTVWRQTISLRLRETDFEVKR